MSNNEVTFNIQVTMKERWVDDFCSMLKWMESCGADGHSSLVGFYSDGDGDFRPKFEFDREFEKKDGRPARTMAKLNGNMNIRLVPEVIFDAG